MNVRTKTGLEILQVSVVIGVLGNLLLRQTPWGLNAFLFVAIFAAALVALMWRHRPELVTKTNLSLAGAMVFFASMFLIRDSIELRVYDTFAILVIMGILLLSSFDVKAHVAGVFHYAAGFVWSGLTSAFGSFVLLGSDIDWKEMPGNKMSRVLFSVLRGIAIAAPLLLIFGALFMAADAAYEGYVNRLLNFDIDVIVSHVMISSVLAWLTAGYFRGAFATPFAAATAADAATQAETRPVGSVSRDTTTNTTVTEHAADLGRNATVMERADEPLTDAKVRTGSGSDRVDLDVQASTLAEDTSFVSKLTSEETELENSLPNNATILEHINISDAPDKKNSPPSEGGVAAASADGVVLSCDSETRNAPTKRDFQNFDNTKLPNVFTLGTVETVIVLGLVDLLFASFVAVQLNYFFGGMDLVQNTPDFKLAEYARRGFGELVAVSALVLPMLLVSHWLLRKDGSKVEWLFKILAGFQIALLFVIMASAVQRLVLLTGELGYGLTTVRFYPMVLMTWLAVVFIWFALTVFRGARNHFAWGALWSAIVILGATNLMNPDQFIVRTNLQLMQQGREFDAYYNAGLSDDAVPTLIQSIDSMSMENKCWIDYEFKRRQGQEFESPTDLRSFNFSRSKAESLLKTFNVEIDTSQCRGKPWL